MSETLTRSAVIATAVKIARSQIGVREVGSSNTGVKVREYQATTTLGGSFWPWCAALMSWDLKQTGKVFDVEIPWSNSASCDVILADAKSRGTLRTTPEVGDVMLVRAAKRGGGYSTSDVVHTELVIEVGAKTFKSVGGNTNGNGGREGYAVIEHTRDISSRYYFVRWVDGMTFPAAVTSPPYAVIALNGTNKTAVGVSMFGQVTYVKIGDVARAFDLPLEWDATNGVVIIDGEEIGLQPRLVDGRAYFGLRDLCAERGWKLRVDIPSRRAIVEAK